MSQKFEVQVRAKKPHEFAIGGKYKLMFGNLEFQEANSHCPYLFHCHRLHTIEKDGTWIYSGIGEFDDNIWKIISQAMSTAPADAPATGARPQRSTELRISTNPIDNEGN